MGKLARSCLVTIATVEVGVYIKHNEPLQGSSVDHQTYGSPLSLMASSLVRSRDGERPAHEDSGYPQSPAVLLTPVFLPVNGSI